MHRILAVTEAAIKDLRRARLQPDVKNDFRTKRADSCLFNALMSYAARANVLMSFR
jgi:hypothetical protein